MYKRITENDSVKQILFGDSGDHLMLINLLRKLCNHPSLLASSDEQTISSQFKQNIMKLLPLELNEKEYSEEVSLFIV